MGTDGGAFRSVYVYSVCTLACIRYACKHIVPTVYIYTRIHVAIWGSQVVRSRHTLNYPAHFTTFQAVISFLVGGFLGRAYGLMPLPLLV